jgi:tetratricopeptide (TPR) repeat protein
MEIIFSRVTFAHDILSDAQKRADYDAYLVELRRSRSIEDLMADALAEVRRAEEAIAREAHEAASAAGIAPSDAPPPVERRSSGSFPAAQPRPTAEPTNTPSEAPASTPPLNEAARREALARRLLAGRAPPRMSQPPPRNTPTPPPLPSAAEAVGALRRRYEDRVAAAKSVMTKRYVEAGEAALKAGDVVAAANSFRIASTLAPDDAVLATRARDVQVKADAMLAETYSRQGAYEEKNQQWAEAARSWARVCRSRPDDAKAHDRAANALLKGDGDMHEAGRLAQRACMLEPTNARYRITLASVYQAAGLALNARRELDTAAQLAPQDDTIQAMIRRAGKSA